MSGSRYTTRATAAVPEAMMDNGNHLAGCLGETMADMDTYLVARFQDAEGNKYAVMSTAATNGILAKMGTGTAVRPAFDTEEAIDLTKAQAAMDVTVIVMPPTGEEEFTPTLAAPDKIVAYVGYEAQDAIAHMGIALIPTEGDI